MYTKCQLTLPTGAGDRKARGSQSIRSPARTFHYHEVPSFDPGQTSL
ncbi:MAG: hypothetical protein AB1847_18495 [bacterium]